MHWTKLCRYTVTRPSGLIALVIRYSVFFFLLVVCVNLWNECVLCNVEYRLSVLVETVCLFLVSPTNNNCMT